MYMKQLLENAPPRIRLTAMVSLSSAFMFMTVLFTPLDIYLHNPTGFIVGWRFLLPSLLMYALAGSLILTALLLLLWYRKILWVSAIFLSCGAFYTYFRFVLFYFTYSYYYLAAFVALFLLTSILLIMRIDEKSADAAMLLLWGVFVASYIQMLFLNGDMVQVTGDSTWYGARPVNLLIWVAIAILPICLRLIFRARKKVFHYEKALIFTAVLITGMQIAGLVSSAMSADLPAGFETDTKALSYEPTTHYSPEENLCVFILDRLDVKFMLEALEKYPELYDMLDGFTLYTNNVSEYQGTFPSVPTMLTQYYGWEGKTYSEYWEEAWAQHTVIDTLRENGFTTNLLIDRLSTYGNIEQLRDKTDNIIDVRIKASPLGLLSAVGRLSFGRFMPYMYKNAFLDYLDPAFGNAFFSFPDPSAQQPAVSFTSDLDFYRYIKQTDFSADSGKKTFSFIHLNCAHADMDLEVATKGYHYNARKDDILWGGNIIDSTRACFEIVNLYCEKMKEIGVYDNTTIILIADHGAGFIVDTPTSSLLIKTRDTTGALLTDNEFELSHKYFAASLLEAVKLVEDNSSLSYFDIIHGASPPPRFFYTTTSWWTARRKTETVSLAGVFEISGDANNISNWNLIETYEHEPEFFVTVTKAY